MVPVERERRERGKGRKLKKNRERERNTIVSQMRIQNDAACVNIRGRDRGSDRGT